MPPDLTVFSEVELPLRLAFVHGCHPPGMKRSAMVRLVDRPGIWQVTRQDVGDYVVEFTMERVDVELHVVGP